MTPVIVRAVAAEEVSAAAWDARIADGFDASVGQTRVEQHGAEIVAVTGIGPRVQADPGVLRDAAVAVARRLRVADSGATLVVDLESFGTASPAAAAAAIAEGLAWGGYRFGMTGPDTFESATLPMLLSGDAEGHPAEVLQAWERGQELGRAVNRARDLVNLPASALTPLRFAEHTKEMLEPSGVRVRLLRERELRAGGYGGVLAIGAGSPHPPVLIELEFGTRAPDIALVGKGVTFDSGGLSLKSPDAQMAMKSDMAGAAAVVATFSMLPTLAPGCSAVAVVPLVENLPGPASVRPGDVVRLRNGATLEILNTDFEGRVILADALARAAEFGPSTIVDIATLTSAAQQALGDGFGALVATDDALASRLEQAGERSGDRVWRMPLQSERAEQIRSEVADYKNFPGVASARVSSAALLLSRFVGGIPWAHVDMAGPAFRAVADGHGAAGGTGFGVRLLTELVAGTV